MLNLLDKDKLANELITLNNHQKETLEYSLSNLLDKFDNIITKYCGRNSIVHKNYNPNIKTILVSQMNGIGDAILLSGFMRELRKIFPTAYIIFTCAANTYEIYKYCPYINEIIIFDIKTDDLIKYSVLLAKEKLWDRYIDFAITPNSGENNKNSLIFNYFSLANECIGYGECNYDHLYTREEIEKRNLLLNQPCTLDLKLLHNHIRFPPECIHEVTRKLYLLQNIIALNNINYFIINTNLEIWYDQNDLNAVNNLLQNINTKKIILGIGGSYGAKLYSIQKYIQILKKINTYELKINNQLPMFFISCGKDELEFAKEIHNKIENTIILYNQLSLRQTMVLISQADMYIGNDTGMTHAASLSNKPIIELNCQAKSTDNYFKYYASLFDRFRPWTQNCVILRPKKALGECNTQKYLVVSHCLYGIDLENEKTIPIKNLNGKLGHCINIIQPKHVFEVYKAIIQDNMNADINTNPYLQKLHFKEIILN